MATASLFEKKMVNIFTYGIQVGPNFVSRVSVTHARSKTPRLGHFSKGNLQVGEN